MHNGLISIFLRCRLVPMSGGGKLVVSLSALFQISFSAHMMPEFLLKILSLYSLYFILYTSSRMFSYMGNFLCKTSSRDILSWNIIAFLHVYFNPLSSILQLISKQVISKVGTRLYAVRRDNLASSNSKLRSIVQN